MNRSILVQIQTIVKYTDISIEFNRVRLGVCPSGIKPSKFITYYNEEGLQKALTECLEYLKEHNEYWEESAQFELKCL